MAQRPANKRLGTQIEEARAEARDAPHTPEMEFYDVDDSDPVEVKSTAETVGEYYQRKGRYQLIGDNHQQLHEAGGVYDFVLRLDNGDADLVTLTAEEVDAIIHNAGLEWPNGSKLKLRHDLIHDL